MTVLIPAYEPDKRLLDLIIKIKAESKYNIVIVDDGSGDKYRSIFNSAKGYGCTVLVHPVNRGKGCALKTGFRYIRQTNENEGIVCADCDGQHIIEDIIRVADKIKIHKNHIIMGCRRFTGRVPFRSRFGNSITRVVFSFATGTKIYDTQTGLRGYSPDMLEWLCSIKGERFEYEINMLLEAENYGYSFYEVNIDTVYLKNNKSSHFRAVKDSIRVYLPIIKFSASSLASALLDFVLLILIQHFVSNLLIAVVGARICSSIFNYSMNRLFVFSKAKSTKLNQSATKYFALVVVVMLLNYAIIYGFHVLLGIPLSISKVLTEATIFLFSYWAQRKFVF